METTILIPEELEKHDFIDKPQFSASVDDLSEGTSNARFDVNHPIFSAYNTLVRYIKFIE